MGTAALSISPTTAVEAGIKAAGITLTLDLSGDTFIAAGGGSGEFGYTTIGGTSDTPADSVIICSGRSVMGGTGTVNVTKISIYLANTEAAQNLAVGLYTDNAGVPDQLVGTETRVDPVPQMSAAWFDVTVNYNVTGGNTYWIAINHSAAGLSTYYNSVGTNTYVYKASTYSSAWPQSFGTGTSSNVTQSHKGTWVQA